MAKPDSGYFGPNSLTWKVNKELTVLFGGVRALLMQAAHPLVAAGARQADTYREDPWNRLMQALSVQLLLPFGTRKEAEQAAARINEIHAGVRGLDPATGERYDALDPDLLLWVHACLEQSTVLFYELTVRPMTAWQKDDYHRENSAAGELLRLPADRIPATYPAMESYITEVLESGRLMATDVSRRVADLLRGGSVPLRIRPFWSLIAFMAIATLPPEIRDLYGYRWTPRRQRVAGALFWAVKRIRPFVPRSLRWVLPAKIAERRLRGEVVDMPILDA